MVQIPCRKLSPVVCMCEWETEWWMEWCGVLFAASCGAVSCAELCSGKMPRGQQEASKVLWQDALAGCPAS